MLVFYLSPLIYSYSLKLCCCFSVDMGEAGEGEMEISIAGPMIDRGTGGGGQLENIPNKVKAIGSSGKKFGVTYLPRHSSSHQASIRFNNHHDIHVGRVK